MPRAHRNPSLGARVWPLDGPRASMLDAIVSGLAMLRSAVPRATALPADIDLVAAEAPDGATIPETLRLLVMALVDEMVPPGDQPSLFTPGTSDELQALARAATTFPVTASQRRDALGDAAAIIREVGLERDLDCHLGTDRDGREAILSAPIPTPTAHVWLLDRLFQRAEMFALGDEVLACERMASSWYFSRWSVGGRGLDPEGMAFTRKVREQEWSLVERETVTLGAPVMNARSPVTSGLRTCPPDSSDSRGRSCRRFWTCSWSNPWRVLERHCGRCAAGAHSGCTSTTRRLACSRGIS